MITMLAIYDENSRLIDQLYKLLDYSFWEEKEKSF